MTIFGFADSTSGDIARLDEAHVGPFPPFFACKETAELWLLENVTNPRGTFEIVELELADLRKSEK